MAVTKRLLQNKILYILIGPKGAGKTYIGTVIHENTDIHFIAVEPVWLALSPGESGWAKVEDLIDQTFQSKNQVMIESLGAGEGFQGMFSSLARKYSIRMIRVFAEAETCLHRVINRDKTRHIPVSIKAVNEYNHIAAEVNFKWDLEFNNERPLPDNEILDLIKRMRTN